MQKRIHIMKYELFVIIELMFFGDILFVRGIKIVKVFKCVKNN